MKVLPPVSEPVHSLLRGDKAPRFEVIDPMEGAVLRSEELLQTGPVLLTFYRGAWCGCCRTDLRDLTETIPLRRRRNTIVLGVFHDLSDEASARIREAYDLDFQLVDDPDGRVAESFGIRRSAAEMAKIEDEFGPDLLALREGQPWIMPMQARYVIGRDGVIAHVEIVVDYESRSCAASLLPIFEALA
jgi:peroxiredoxin